MIFIAEEKNIIFAVLAVIVLVTAVGLVYMIKAGPGRATFNPTLTTTNEPLPTSPVYTIASQPAYTTTATQPTTYTQPTTTTTISGTSVQITCTQLSEWAHFPGRYTMLQKAVDYKARGSGCIAISNMVTVIGRVEPDKLGLAREAYQKYSDSGVLSCCENPNSGGYLPWPELGWSEP